VTLVINTEVISTDAVTINTLNITPNDELSINGGDGFSNFTITNGMPNGNFGTLDLENVVFEVSGGTINNSGLIVVKSSGMFLAADGSGTVTLNGAGMVVLEGTGFIDGDGDTEHETSNFINDDNNISGTGTVGLYLNIINHGTFETNNLLLAGTMRIVGSAGGGSFDNENLLIADANGILILGMDGKTSKIINNDLIELKNSVQNTQSIIEIAGTLFLENRQVLGLGTNIAGNVIVSDGHAAELILDGGTLDGVGQLGDNNLTLFIEALTYVVSGSGTMAFAPGATTIQPTGVLEAIDGSVMDDFSPIANQGTIAALTGGAINVFSNITNSNGGVVNIGANSEILLQPGVVVSGTIQFTGSSAKLETTSAFSTHTTVSGTGTGDSFGFLYLPFLSGDHAIFQQNGGTGTLSVLNSGGATIASVTLAGQYTSADFTVVASGGTGGDVLVETNLASPTPPSPTPLTATTDTGATYLNAGHLVTITLTTSLVETVTGTPTLQLNDGEVAGYTGGSGTNTLTFAYAVQTGAPGDNVADLQVTGLNLPTGSSIVDSNGNSLTSGSVMADFGIQIDTTTVPATSVQQEILGLYAALYGRVTDSGSVSYWTGIVGQQPDGAGVTTANAGATAVTLNDAAVLGQAFVNTQSTYFNSLYGSLNDSAFINAMYVNIGGNAGDPGGVAYWAGLLQQAETAGQSVQAARAGLVGEFVQELVDYNLAAGAAGLTATQLLAATQRQEAVDNKIAVSLALSNASQQAGGSILVVHTVGDAAYEAATTLIHGVTYDPATVTAAILGINNAVAHQNLSLI
jgi:hypothetical protein